MRKCLSIILAAMLFLTAVPSVFAQEETAEPETFVIEAEAGVIRQNFQIVEDRYAAGGAYLRAAGGVSGLAAANAAEPDVTYDFETRRDGVFTAYLRIRSTAVTATGMFAGADGQGYTLTASVPTVSWVWKKISLGSLKAGNHQLKIKGQKKGFLFDRAVITTESGYDPDGSLKEKEAETAEEEEEVAYLPGREKYEKMDIYEAPEQVPGSFYMEAEDGTLVSPMTVYEDETASGGKYIAAVVGSKKLDVPESIQTVHARYKLNVTQKGTYSVWARIITPTPKSKSTWFSVDNQEYKQFSSSTIPNFTWKKVYTVNWDVGCHLVNIKYREAGQQIDNLIVTNDTKFTPKGLGSLPGEEERAEIESEETRQIIKVFVDGTQLVFNTNPKKDGNYYMVPAKAVARAMGADLTVHDGYWLVSRGRDYVKYYVGQRKAIINGREEDIKKEPYMVEDAALMAPIDQLVDTFGGTWRHDQAANSIYITNPPDETCREMREGEFSLSLVGYAGLYELPCSNPDAKVEVFTRLAGARFWTPHYAPVYRDGVFKGSVSGLKEGSTYEVKVRILDNGTEDVFVTKQKARSLNNADDGTGLTMEKFAYDAGELLLVPTFENLSYYLDVDSDKYTCEVAYREKGGQWKDAYTPYWDQGIGQFRGSIVNLTPNTEYEVRAKVLNGRSTVREYTAETVTWNENPAIAQTIQLRDVYDGNTLVFEDVHGSEDGWIKVVGDADTILSVDKNTRDNIYVSNSSYIIFENITMQGAGVNGVHVANGSHDIRIVNCDISDWGRVGVHDLVDGRYRDYEGTFINNDAGVKIADVSKVVVERCYIHDPTGTTNSWNGPTWNQVHPAGPNAVHYRCSNSVIRYNDFPGSDGHRWNDTVESFNNGYRSGGPSRDCDIYGNTLLFGQDDGIEFDGGQMNSRFYLNKVEGFLCGMSTAPNLAGPSYIFRNLITNLGDETGKTSAAIKHGGGSSHTYGHEYDFHNTFDVMGKGLAAVGYSNEPDRKRYLAVTRNNILSANRSASDGWAIDDPYYQDANSFDYDLLGNRLLEDGAGMVNVKQGEEAHGIFGVPTYESQERADFMPAGDNIGLNKGEVLENFNDSYVKDGKPDMGALERGGPIQFLPARPVDMSASHYQVNLSSSKTEETVTVRLGEIGEGRRFRLRTNEYYNWLTVTTADGAAEGEAAPNSAIELKVTADPGKIAAGFVKGNGCFLFRLDNGYSIPITVYCTK